MELENRGQMAAFLEDAAVEKWTWAAFDRSNPDKGFQGFSSTTVAEEYCAANNSSFDFQEQNFHDVDYCYLPVDSLLAAYHDRPVLARDILLASVEAQILDENAGLFLGQSLHVLRPFLEKELFFPLQWRMTVWPAEQVTQFHVIEHTHPGHQVYEVGHETNVLKSFAAYKEAEEFLKVTATNNAEFGVMADLILAGQYKDQSLKLDMEGYPESYSGIALFRHQANRNIGRVLFFDAVNHLEDPVTIKHYLFARFDHASGQLNFYNDRLEQIKPQELKSSTYPSHFINEILTIKNSEKIMNEQSFDYVKNQLFYLGFGEEIAKPLRVKMEQNLAEFTLPHTRMFGQDEASSVLRFSKGDQKDMTFFNGFDLTLKQPGKEDLTQRFFVGKEYNYTLQERYNMMDGRAVYREQPVVKPVKDENGEEKLKPTGETYFGWKALDFKASDGYGNFLPKNMFWNHQKEIGKYPIKGVEDNYNKQRLIGALQKGNRVDVVLLRDGQEMPAKMVANPRMGRLDFYDTNGQSLIVRKVEKQALDQNQKVEMTPQEVQRAAIARAAEQKQEQSQAQKPGAADEQKNNTAQRKKQGVHI